MCIIAGVSRMNNKDSSSFPYMNTFHPFPELFDELRQEVLTRCTRGSRALLGLTCKREHALALQDAILGNGHNLLFALVTSNTDEDSALLQKTLGSPRFAPVPRVPGGFRLHDLIHFAIRGEQGALVRWFMKDCPNRCGISTATCPECLQVGALTLNYDLIFYLAQVHVSQRSSIAKKDYTYPAHILTVEALRMNSRSLLQWLERNDLFEPCFVLDWDRYLYRRRGEEFPVSNALDWYRWYLTIHGQCDASTRHGVRRALFECMVARQWTMAEINTSTLWETTLPRVSVEGGVALDLFTLGMRFKNANVIETTWKILEQEPTSEDFFDALVVLSQYDDEEQTWGQRLLKLAMLGKMAVSLCSIDYLMRIIPKIKDKK